MENLVNMNKQIPTCPVGCMYCMAQKIDIRLEYWKNTSRIGINKSCVFFNRLPQDPKLNQMNFPWHLLDGEYLGFQGITDCFWDIFKDDLRFLVDKVQKSRVRKVCLISKIPLDDEQLDILLNIKDRLVVCYSVTGLDKLEKSSTNDRIKSLVKLRDAGIDAFPVMHPYIHGYSDSENVLKLLKENGFYKMNWKGFRYNKNNMKILEKYIPKNILDKYVGNGSEEEILLGNEYMLELAKKYGISFCDLKEYLHKKNDFSEVIKFEEAKRQVEELAKMCVFSTSGKKDDVIKECINRRIS